MGQGSEQGRLRAALPSPYLSYVMAVIAGLRVGYRVMPSEPIIRPIEPGDDPAIAEIIRVVMPEQGAGGAGFAIHDAEVDGMFAAYNIPRASYFVVEDEGVIIAGAGLAQLIQGPLDTCELRKMYMLPHGRGRGIGAKLLATCLTAAKEHGYARCYLETLTGMRAARKLYEKNRFTRLDAPMGDTGHYGCDCWYARPL